MAVPHPELRSSYRIDAEWLSSHEKKLYVLSIGLTLAVSLAVALRCGTPPPITFVAVLVALGATIPAHELVHDLLFRCFHAKPKWEFRVVWRRLIFAASVTAPGTLLSRPAYKLVLIGPTITAVATIAVVLIARVPSEVGLPVAVMSAFGAGSAICDMRSYRAVGVESRPGDRIEDLPNGFDVYNT